MANLFRWPDGRLFPFTACFLLATAGRMLAGDGYLPAVGPVPIRLATPRPPAPTVNWPPLVQAPKPQPPPTPAVTNPPPQQPPPPMPAYTPPSYLGPLGPLGPAEPPVDISVSSAPTPQPQPVNPLMPFQGPGAEQSPPPPPGVGDPQNMLNSLLLVSPKNPGSKNPQVIMPAFIPPPPPVAPFPSSHATYEVK